jgi:hypothetical protein
LIRIEILQKAPLKSQRSWVRLLFVIITSQQTSNSKTRIPLQL